MRRCMGWQVTNRDLSTAVLRSFLPLLQKERKDGRFKKRRQNRKQKGPGGKQGEEDGAAEAGEEEVKDEETGQAAEEAAAGDADPSTSGQQQQQVRRWSSLCAGMLSAPSWGLPARNTRGVWRMGWRACPAMRKPFSDVVHHSAQPPLSTRMHAGPLGNHPGGLGCLWPPLHPLRHGGELSDGLRPATRCSVHVLAHWRSVGLVSIKY